MNYQSHIREITDSFTSQHIPQQIYMITNGSGQDRSSFLHSLESVFGSMPDWEVLRLNPASDILSDLSAVLPSLPDLPSDVRSSNISGLQSTNTTMRHYYASTIISSVLTYMQQHGRRLLILIDDVAPSRDMQLFIYEFQMLVRQDLDMCLVLAGNAKQLKELQDMPSISFLYRATKISLSEDTSASN